MMARTVKIVTKIDKKYKTDNNTKIYAIYLEPIINIEKDTPIVNDFNIYIISDKEIIEDKNGKDIMELIVELKYINWVENEYLRKEFEYLIEEYFNRKFGNIPTNITKILLSPHTEGIFKIKSLMKRIIDERFYNRIIEILKDILVNEIENYKDIIYEFEYEDDITSSNIAKYIIKRAINKIFGYDIKDGELDKILEVPYYRNLSFVIELIDAIRNLKYKM